MSIYLDKEYETMSGNRVILFRIIGNCVFGAFNEGDNWHPAKWDKNSGMRYVLSAKYDLVEKENEHVCYINHYVDDLGITQLSVPYLTLEEAKTSASYNKFYVRTHKVILNNHTKVHEND